MHGPLIHLNGTSPERLLEALDEAYAALDTAIEKLAACAPNMRDYYPLPDGVEIFNQDVAEHRAMLSQLRTMQSTLEQVSESIWLQQERRKRPHG
jgi:hypothetical protein